MENGTLDQASPWDANLGGQEDTDNPWLDPVDHKQKFAASASLLMRESDDEDDDGDGEHIYDDVRMFLETIGEPQLLEHFKRNRITLGQLLELDERDLIRCGIEFVGDRKKILSSIGKMHCERWTPSSLLDLTERSLLCGPGIYLALNDINKHLDYIGVTFGYIRRHVSQDQGLLEIGKDYVGVQKIISEIEDTLTTCGTTLQQLRALDALMRSVSSVPALQPANHIDHHYIKWFRVRRILPKIALVISIVGLGLLVTGARRWK